MVTCMCLFSCLFINGLNVSFFMFMVMSRKLTSFCSNYCDFKTNISKYFTNLFLKDVTSKSKLLLYAKDEKNFCCWRGLLLQSLWLAWWYCCSWRAVLLRRDGNYQIVWTICALFVNFSEQIFDFICVFPLNKARFFLSNWPNRGKILVFALVSQILPHFS